MVIWGKIKLPHFQSTPGSGAELQLHFLRAFLDLETASGDIRARSDMVWTGMAYRHFLGCLESIEALIF